jgi:Na+/H+ antiporter NhaD/arsenite permease-like protein
MKQQPTTIAAISETKNIVQIPITNHLTPLLGLVQSEAILSVAIVATLVTCFFVPLDQTYVSYIDTKTLACLFSTLAVVAALKHIHVFEMLGQKIVLYCNDLRKVILTLTFITFFASMLLANDMALLTFLPLSFYVLKSTNKTHKMAFTFVMQNIAANLGGMITPFGNPQNLYLYSYYTISNGEFFKIMLVPFVAATVLIVICCLFVKPEKVQLEDTTSYPFHKKSLLLYSLLFLLAILIVFRVFPYVLGTLLITATLLIADKKAVKEVNYSLLLTFFVFFIFAGNMARIPAVKATFESILPLNPLLIGILSCQVISNVPSAVLLSRFTTNYQSLLVAVNIGGLGSLIASLASLITFNEYKKHNPTKVKGYVLLFTAINVLFLAVLYGIQILKG